MPRQMPRFDLHLSAEANIANEIVIAGELSRSNGCWSRKRLEFLYELAYLRVFVAWEGTLEGIFYRSLCGYESTSGQEQLVCGKYYASIANAEAAALAAENKTSYLLWHASWQLLLRFRKHIGPLPPTNPPTPARQENAVASNQHRLDALAAVRHRIVHEQEDGRVKFDAATLLLAGRTYPASRPGKFLRDMDFSVFPPRKRLESAISELVGLAAQMV